MSGEVRETIFLRCDANWADGQRCTVMYGWNDGWHNNEDSLDALTRKARGAGWSIDVENRGLKGIEVKSLCPDHAELTLTAIPDPPSKERP